MKVALISQGSKSSQMVGDALKKYFDQVDMIDLMEIDVRLGEENGIFYQNKPFDEYDCVYVKGSFRYAHLLQSITSLLEGNVPYIPLPTEAFTTVHNKLFTHLTLQRHNIPMPKTWLFPTVELAKRLLKKARYPVVMKLPEGTQGKGVMFADSYSSASSLLDALGALNQPFIVQEYVETEGTDIRVLVVGDKVVGAMRRRAQKEEKRSNIHAGGSGEKIELKREIVNLALDTAKALKVDICGVDILEHPLGSKVIEANISPGLQGLSKVVDVDLGDEIARFLYEQTVAALAKRKDAKAVALLQQIELEKVRKEVPEEGKPVVSKISFRGERILLPEFVTKGSGFSDRKEYVMRVRKGKVEIEEGK